MYTILFTSHNTVCVRLYTVHTLLENLSVCSFFQYMEFIYSRFLSKYLHKRNSLLNIEMLFSSSQILPFKYDPKCLGIQQVRVVKGVSVSPSIKLSWKKTKFPFNCHIQSHIQTFHVKTRNSQSLKPLMMPNIFTQHHLLKGKIEKSALFFIKN